MALPESVEALASRLLPYDAPVADPTGRRAAAVLIALHGGEDGVRIVFVEKGAHVRSHAGQVAFPGGRDEKIDANPLATALREAREETGIEPASVMPLGILPVGDTRVDFDVTPVVGWWTGDESLAAGDIGEIAAVHDLDVDDLLDPANRLAWQLPNGHTGPGFVVGDLFIWGFTAGLLDSLFELAQWTVPWDETRCVPVPSRFHRR